MSATVSRKITPEMLRAVAQAELGIVSAADSIPRRALTTAPMSHSQSRIWFIQQLDPSSAVYVIPIALRLIGNLDTNALSGALSEITRRHEILRTTFYQED